MGLMGFAGGMAIQFVLPQMGAVFDEAKAEKAGVVTEAHIWKGVPHCFPVMFTNMLPEARIAMDDMVSFIQRHLHSTPTAFVARSA